MILFSKGLKSFYVIIKRSKHIQAYLLFVKTQFLLLFALVHFSFAQQLVFIDADTKLPVYAVNVYNASGRLIGFSNREGLMNIINNKKTAEVYPLHLTLQHVSYNTKLIAINEKEVVDTVLLERKTNRLNEVFMPSPISSDFLCLRGYFRSLETFDRKHKYFSDGIVEFYIPLKKGKVKYRLLDFRIYRDSAVEEDYKEKMWTFFQAPRMVEMFRGKLFERLKGYSLSSNSGNRIEILKKGTEVGHIQLSQKPETINFYLDTVLPDSVMIEKIFRIEARIKHEIYNENYAQHVLEDLSAKNLLNVYQLITGTIKRKAEYGAIPYEIVNEFYVQYNYFLSSKEYKAIGSSLTKSLYKTLDKSSFSSPFWEGLDDYNIRPLKVDLANQLGRNLKLVK